MVVEKKVGFVETDTILDILSDGILITDEMFNICYVNKVISDYTGLYNEQLLGKSLKDIHSFYSRKEIETMQQNFLQGTAVFHEKTIYINKRFLNIHIKAIYKNNIFKGLFAEFYDVTAERQSRQSHDNLFRMYTMMFNTTQLAMLTIDKQGIVTSFNSAAENLFGIYREDILNKDFLSQNNYLSEFKEALETGKEYKNIKKEISINEITTTVLLDICVLKDASGKVLGVLGVFKDITEYSESENLAHRQDKYAVMAQLAAGLADEMRNPLTSVKGFMQLIHHRMRNTRQKEYVELALDELKRMEKHIRNFLLFSSPDAPVMKLVSINRLLGDVVNDYKANFRNINIELILPKEEFFICVDEEQIKQVFINLTQNAVEAVSTKDGIISVKVNFSKNEPYIYISFVDNGSGMEEDYLPHIFEPFFTTKEYNTGLGLTIAQHIISAHGGNIKATNNPSKGVTMKVFLPFGAYISKKMKIRN